MSNPRIYVACLASYNNGVLHGRWIELDGLDYDDVQAEIAEMLRESPEPNVTVKRPECGGDGDGGLAASCVSNERKACPMCGGTVIPPLLAVARSGAKRPSPTSWQA